MGQDKALILVDGKPLLRRVYDVAVAVCPRVAVISPWPERYHPILPENINFVQEPLPLEGTKPPGPLVGLLRGLEWIKASSYTRDTLLRSEHGEHEALPDWSNGSVWVLLLACDLPRLSPETLNAGVAQLPTLSSEVLALVSRNPKGWEPLCGFYRQACLATLQPFVQEGGRSFQHWLETIPVQPWHLEDQTVLFNCNTVADWETVKDVP